MGVNSRVIEPGSTAIAMLERLPIEGGLVQEITDEVTPIALFSTLVDIAAVIFEGDGGPVDYKEAATTAIQNYHGSCDRPPAAHGIAARRAAHRARCRDARRSAPTDPLGTGLPGSRLLRVSPLASVPDVC